MSLFELHPNLKTTNRLLERLAYLFEVYLAQVHGIVVDPKPIREEKDINQEILYTTDQDMMQQELEKQFTGNKPEEDV